MVAAWSLGRARRAGPRGERRIRSCPARIAEREGDPPELLFISVFCFAIFLLVEGLLIAFVIRYRRRSGRGTRTARRSTARAGSSSLWTLGPVLILFVIAAFVFVKLPGIQDVPSACAGSPTSTST